VKTRWLAPMTLALLSLGSGWTTRASAQEAEVLNNKLIFAVMVNQIFNEGDLSLVDALMAKDVTNNGSPLGRDGFKAMVKDLRMSTPQFRLTVDDVVTQGARVIGRVTQTAGGTSASRIILLRIEGGLVQEHWSWVDQPGSAPPFGLRAAAVPPSAASAN